MANKIKKKFIEDEIFSDISAEIDSDVSAEAALRSAADADLQTQIDALDGNFATDDDVAALQAELDATQAGAGLDADGNYIPRVEGDVNYIDGLSSLAEEIYWLDSQVGLHEGQIELEIEDRTAADNTLQANIDALQADVDQNELDGDNDRAAIRSEFAAADSTLQSNIDVEKGRIDAILEASTADADSFKEIVDLINSVDTENDNAFAAYVLSNDAAVDALQADVDQNELDGDNDRAAIRTEFADADTALHTTISAEIDDDVLVEKNRAEGEEAAIRSEFAAADTALHTVISAEIDADVLVEKTRAETAEALLQADIQELQAVAWFNETVLHDGTDSLPSLAHEPVSGSLVLFAGRVALHEGVDYTISGKDVTFTGSVVVGGAEGLVSGEKIYAKYQK